MINTENWKVGIYCRLSREDELEDESKSITNQREMCTNWCLKNGLRIIDEYIDDGISGSTDNRPSFKRMLKDLDDKKINMVVVKDTSRLARNFNDSTRYAFVYFPERNIRLYSIIQNYDSIDPKANSDSIYFKSFFDEWFIRDTSTKIRKGLRDKKEIGKFLGGVAPYGYYKDPLDKHKLIIDEYSSEIVKRIFNMFASGMGLKKICYILTNEGIAIPSIYKNLNRSQKSTTYGKWVPRTIADMLVNETYIGNLTQGRSKKVSYLGKKKIRVPKKDWIIVPNSCPRIIDNDTWEIVQNIYKRNKNRQTTSHEHLLRGLLVCKECNHTIGISLSKWKNKDGTTKQKYYCYCNYYRKMSKYKACTPHKISYNEVEEKVLKKIKEMCNKHLKINNLENILKYNDKTNKLILELQTKKKKIENEIKLTNTRINDIYMDKINKVINEELFHNTYKKIIENKEKNKNELQEIDKRLFQLKNKNVNTKDKCKKHIEEFLKFKKISIQLISTLIDKIVIDEEKNIEIIYKFKKPLNIKIT
jgi:DNA invertase Pin-like site-specific DNA recombinase